MTFSELEDALRPTDDAFKAFYERGYRTWYKLWADAVGDCTLPSTCLEWEHRFPQHPFLPVGLDPDNSGLVTAKSTWLSSEGDCSNPPFEQTFQMAATIGKPTSIVLSDDPNLSLFEWFGKDDGHLVILIFAWAYALSARWAEIIPRASRMEYTTSQAPWAVYAVSDEAADNSKPMVVELGKLTGEAARWWAAVLAPGEGWKVAIPHERWRLLSPWSVTKEFGSINILLTSSSSHMSSHPPTPASFRMALNADAQSRAALAAALLLPLAALDNRKVLLHAPRGLCRLPADDLCQLDRLLTLSINAHGMKAILGSVFYEPGIPANACGAWLQGTMAVLKSKGTGNLHVLARMFFDRSPHISYLWLGGIITGAHRHFLRHISGLLGLNNIDLQAGAWTGTLLSFIQEPVQEPPRDFPPIYPYPPLGDTDIRDTDLGVQLHAHCPGNHGLQFLSVTWDCVGGRKDIQTTGSTSVVSRDYVMDSEQDEDKDLSEGVTRNLFSWMRDMDGFAVAERDIYRHEWIDAFDSDDESVHPEGDGRSTTGLNMDAQMGRWMASTLTRRCNSI
ncbi:hypothetical protein GGS23DRAFT_602766 [Durotheca rogersii]|uniref:uncharacterized protein n=1 Tax=Durotheca rogersii TaxID=419775 RepID=UPI00221FEC54|nr:uncharacterized protein GGS23DRAFT_602766 [Durotheca rogersii]KAI5866408.1 hypothetical protein GGS23DRAFT_602766 [Durotheca rogersii]